MKFSFWKALFATLLIVGTVLLGFSPKALAQTDDLPSVVCKTSAKSISQKRVSIEGRCSVNLTSIIQGVRHSAYAAYENGQATCIASAGDQQRKENLAGTSCSASVGFVSATVSPA